MTGDVEHAIVTPHRCRAVCCTFSCATHFVCVCRSSGRVLYFSFRGVCRSTYTLSFDAVLNLGQAVSGALASIAFSTSDDHISPANNMGGPRCMPSPTKPPCNRVLRFAHPLKSRALSNS